jgi:hypothetical protein
MLEAFTPGCAPDATPGASRGRLIAGARAVSRGLAQMDLSRLPGDPDDRSARHGVEGGVGSGGLRGSSVALPIRRGAAAVLVIGLVVTACGGSSASAAPASGSGSGTGSGSSPAPNASSPAVPTPASTDAAQSTEPTASPAAGGNGGTGNGAIPTLSDGQWTAGKAHADVKGDVTDTVDGAIMAGLAITTDQNTTLIYLAPDGTKQVAVGLAGGTASTSVTTPQWVGGGGTTVGAQCSVAFSKTDDKALSGTITCSHAPVLNVGSIGAEQYADIVVTFDATR